MARHYCQIQHIGLSNTTDFEHAGIDKLYIPREVQFAPGNSYNVNTKTFIWE